MKKRIFGLFLCLVMVLSLVPSTAFAAEIEASGTCGDNLTWTVDDEGTMTISGTGAMDDQSERLEKSPWAHYRDEIKQIIIENGVTSIGNHAFDSCRSLASVTIPDSVTSIGEDAFSWCENLTGVTIPTGVTSIGNWAFDRCSSLASVTIPDSVTSIGMDAFSDCSSLVSVTIPASVTSFGYYVFDGCSSLTEVTFLGNAPALGYLMFADVTATVSYPQCSSTWTDEVKQDCGGTLTWVASEHGGEIIDTPEVPATCGADGREAVSHCSVCGKALSDGKTIPATEKHTVVVDMEAKEATCGADGHEAVSHCSVCGKTLSDGKTIPATGKHAVVVDMEAKEANCGADGHEVVSHCSVCDKTLSKGKTIPATGNHTEEIDEYVAPTCATTGLTEGSHCSVCGKVLVAQEVIPATGNHTEVIDMAAKKATCSADGHEAVSHCDVCEKALSKGKTIPATGNHTTKATTTNATLSANGKIVYKCPTCGKTMQSTKTIYMPKTFSLSYTKYTYNGKVKTPTVTVKDSKGNVLKEGTDYKVTYASGRKAVGTYKVTIEGEGNYSFKKTLTFKINPAATKIVSATNVATKSIKVKWNKAAGAGGYQVQLKKGSTVVKTVKVSGASTLTKTLTKLTKDSTYKVYVRSYKTVNSTNYYSAWSAYKSVKVAK